MTDRPFRQMDVFTTVPGWGNPLAVVLDATGLDDAAMQRFARWTNLSETTFVLPPTEAGRAGGADYRVRIFTPGGELPFAGHPTLGTCRAWLDTGGVPRVPGQVVQECGVGLVTLRQHGARLAFAAPPLRRSAPDAGLLAKITTALGLTPNQVVAAQMLDNGPVWLGLLLDRADTVRHCDPDHAQLAEIGHKVGVASVIRSSFATGLISRSSREARAFVRSEPPPERTDPEGDADLEVRAFAAPIGVNEDPVTGSLNASLAQWLIADGVLPDQYVAVQGLCLGRAGRVFLTRDSTDQVWVGGDVAPCIDGTVQL
ncbi:MAG: PhzF family phenazine biosynthesis protein [Burkholderiaceae bacterium]|nr:PhzF family phenazine biosynthesis protein [Burkholderiaceae bacterium]